MSRSKPAITEFKAALTSTWIVRDGKLKPDKSLIRFKKSETEMMYWNWNVLIKVCSHTGKSCKTGQILTMAHE